MMRKITLTDESPKLFFEKIVNACHNPLKATSNLLKDRIFECYDQYQWLSPEFSEYLISRFSSQEGNIIRNLYSSNRKDIALLRETYKQNIIFCPFCGIESPNTLDHLLPKQQFPEFAILLNNLFPMCNRCNNDRLDDIYDENGTRNLLNLEKDTFLEARFLIAEITYDGDDIEIINYRIIPGRLNAQQEAIVKNHMKNLKLQKKFNRILSSTVSEIYDETRQGHHTNRESIKISLEQGSIDIAKKTWAKSLEVSNI